MTGQLYFSKILEATIPITPTSQSLPYTTIPLYFLFGSKEAEHCSTKVSSILFLSSLYLYNFSDKEAKHILELDTKEDRLIGYFGTAKKYNGNVYVSARKRAEDGSIEEQFSVFKIDSLGNISELGNIDDIDT